MKESKLLYRLDNLIVGLFGIVSLLARFNNSKITLKEQ